MTEIDSLFILITTQAPHAICTIVALVAGHVGLSEERIRIIAPNIGGGFGGNVFNLYRFVYKQNFCVKFKAFIV